MTCDLKEPTNRSHPIMSICMYVYMKYRLFVYLWRIYIYIYMQHLSWCKYTKIYVYIYMCVGVCINTHMDSEPVFLSSFFLPSSSSFSRFHCTLLGLRAAVRFQRIGGGNTYFQRHESLLHVWFVRFEFLSEMYLECVCCVCVCCVFSMCNTWKRSRCTTTQAWRIRTLTMSVSHNVTDFLEFRRSVTFARTQTNLFEIQIAFNKRTLALSLDLALVLSLARALSRTHKNLDTCFCEALSTVRGHNECVCDEKRILSGCVRMRVCT